MASRQRRQSLPGSFSCDLLDQALSEQSSSPTTASKKLTRIEISDETNNPLSHGGPTPDATLIDLDYKPRNDEIRKNPFFLSQMFWHLLRTNNMPCVDLYAARAIYFFTHLDRQICRLFNWFYYTPRADQTFDRLPPPLIGSISDIEEHYARVFTYPDTSTPEHARNLKICMLTFASFIIKLWPRDKELDKWLSYGDMRRVVRNLFDKYVRRKDNAEDVNGVNLETLEQKVKNLEQSVEHKMEEWRVELGQNIKRERDVLKAVSEMPEVKETPRVDRSASRARDAHLRSDVSGATRRRMSSVTDLGSCSKVKTEATDLEDRTHKGRRPSIVNRQSPDRSLASNTRPRNQSAASARPESTELLQQNRPRRTRSASVSWADPVGSVRTFEVDRTSTESDRSSPTGKLRAASHSAMQSAEDSDIADDQHVWGTVFSLLEILCGLPERPEDDAAKDGDKSQN